MRKKSIVNICHYVTKYILILFPIIVICLSFFVTNDSFRGSSEITTSYKYTTNTVNSVNDLYIGNIYYFSLNNYTNSTVLDSSLSVQFVNLNYSSSSSSLFINKTFNGLNSFYGSYVWTMDNVCYYSYGTSQYILDKSTSTWSTKTWNGLSSFTGSSIWTDGINYYCSNGTSHYVLDKETSTWSTKTWYGLTNFEAKNIWTDGINYYYSKNSVHYVLDKETSTWSVKTWTGLTVFYGYYMWSDGTNIYYSYNDDQYVLDVSTSTWSVKTWTGLTSFSGLHIWFANNSIYFSNQSSHYVLDKETSTWSTKTWYAPDFTGLNIWTDGTNVYFTYTDTSLSLVSQDLFFNTVNVSDDVYSISYLDLFKANVASGSFILKSVDSNFTDVSFISSCPNNYNVVNGYAYTNGGLFDDCCKFMKGFYNLPLNDFYKSTLNVLGFQNVNMDTVLGFTLYMPLWIFWVYMIDLVLDFMLFIPKIAHKWLDKGYGAD